MKQWYSAQELVGIAGLPSTRIGLFNKTSREGWQSRPRQGQGDGKEYAFSSLPQGVQAALALRWWATETEGGVMQKAKDGTSSHIQHAWANYALLKKPSKAKAQQRMAALMALQTLQTNGQTLTQAIATLQSQGAGHNRMTFLDGLKA